MYDNNIMAKNRSDRLAILAGDIGSPRVVAAIDKVLDELKYEWLDLMDLRRMAVRRHGDSSAPPDPPALLEAQAPIRAEASAHSQAQAKPMSNYDGTIGSLVFCYQKDADSSFHKLRFRTREHYELLCRRIERDHGKDRIKDLGARDLLRWHEEWSRSGPAIAHSLIRMARILFGFGMTMLGDAECARMAAVRSAMRFEMGNIERYERMTADHAIAIRKEANEKGFHSIALAQAIQFDCRLRQKDVIGEWVPENEFGEDSSLKSDGKKWVRGVVWSEIDENLILRHVTSKRQRMVEVNLRQMNMVMEELRIGCGLDNSDAEISRSMLPPDGPIIVYEATGRPYSANQYRQMWRDIARRLGISDKVRNADSRTGNLGVPADSEANEDLDDDASVELDLEIEQGQTALTH